MEMSSIFRSVLPHEPLPIYQNNVQCFGYVHIQGALSPKMKTKSNEKPENEEEEVNLLKASDKLASLSNEEVKNMLMRALHGDENYLPSDSILKELPVSCRSVLSVELILEGNGNKEDKQSKSGSDPSFQITRARIKYPSPIIARAVVAFLRHHKVSPNILFPQIKRDAAIQYQYSNKHVQATQVTQVPLPPPESAWPRIGMPKFRRLLIRQNDDGNAIQKIRHERSRTRFVFMTNIIDCSSKSYGSDNDDNIDNSRGGGDTTIDVIQRMRMEPYLFQDAIRAAIVPYLEDPSADTIGMDSSDMQTILPPEVFVPSKKQQSPFKYCHLGMRSNLHAQTLIRNLQGKEITLKIAMGSQRGANSRSNTDSKCYESEVMIVTGKLFLDFADVTQRSAARSNRMNPSAIIPDAQDDLLLQGEPSKPECTSVTQSMIVPGLQCIHEFITTEEEQVLLACLTGPHAPWAPSQQNFSQTGSVKRRVQHYGYVFDYETADVLRDRHVDSTGTRNENIKSLCPPLPVLPAGYESWTNIQLQNFTNDAVRDGNGWDVLAAIIEKVRRHDFSKNEEIVYPNPNAINALDLDEKDRRSDSLGMTSRSSANITKHYQFINQMTVNEYKRGQGIGSHIDTKSAFDDGLLSLSLGSDTVMEFENQEKQKKLFHLPPRSLLLMSGPARYSWKHQIVTRMTDCIDGKVIPRKTRVSLTLRTAITLSNKDGHVQPMKRVESRSYPPKWGYADATANDRNSNSSHIDYEDIATPETEIKHVHAVYDAVAAHWHNTRGKRGVLWPGATQFLKQLPKGSIVADIGCGDGKYFPAIWEAGSYVIGTDISEPLLQTSIGACSWAETNVGPQNRQVSTINLGLNARPAVVVADCMHIPLKTNSFDAAICIAVMHHLSTAPRRRRCLQELSRIVKVGGRINVQAWALEQDSGSRRKFAGTDVFVPFNAQPHYLNKIKIQDSTPMGMENKGVAEMYSDAYDGAEYDESKGLVVFQRYCHMYKEGELEGLVSEIDSLEMVESGFESGNHFVILKVVQ